jgi:hypothetical protein
MMPHINRNLPAVIFSLLFCELRLLQNLIGMDHSYLRKLEQADFET